MMNYGKVAEVTREHLSRFGKICTKSDRFQIILGSKTGFQNLLAKRHNDLQLPYENLTLKLMWRGVN